MALKVYSYKGKIKGKTTKGVVSSETLAGAKSQLRDQKIREVVLKEQKEKSKSSLNVDITWGPFGAIPPKDILIFTKKMSTMMRSGLPVIDALSLIESQTSNANLKRVTNEIIARLNAGSSLSEAFSSHSRHFDNVYLNMIQAGEVSGGLDIFLGKLVEILEKQQKIRAGIKSALFYPVTLVVVSVGITIFMLTNVVPTFQKLYEGLGAELPAPTQMIIDGADWIAEGGLFRAFGVLVLIFVINKLLDKYIRPWRKFKGRVALKMPIFGNIITKAAVARITLLMANLWAAGVSVIEILAVCQTVTKNLMFVDAMGVVKRKIASGVPLSVLFAEQKVIPADVSQLIAVGEQTGNVDEMMDSIARYYEEEFDTVVKGLTTVIEPIMIVFVGLLIGLMVVALYLPIFSAGDAFS